MPNKISPNCLGDPRLKRLAGQRLDFRLQPRHVLRELARKPRQHRAIDADSASLHSRQHGGQRALQRFINRGHVFRDQTRLQAVPQPQGDVGILGRIFGGLVERHLGEANKTLALSGDFAERNRSMAQHFE